jgi:NAD-dependent dihydropyrimidine dehydrogenase PreA subunit
MARVIIEESKCTGCGQCVEICLVDVLRFAPSTGRAIAAYPEDCDGCRLCFDECPEACITIDDSEKSLGTKSIYDVLGMDDTWDVPNKN